MSLDPESGSRRQIAEQAAHWLLTLRSEEPTAAQREEFIDWLRESPQHISELLRALKLQRDLARFKGWHRIRPMDDSDASRTVTWLEVPRRIAARQSFRSMRIKGLVAASVAVLCILGAWVFTRLDRTVLTTQHAERREVTLADGSVVDLAPDSEVVVRYRAHERLLTLEHGEALFHVAKNFERPFIVQAAETRVRALGTVFNVQRGDRGISVTVVEGRVSVSVSQQSPSWAVPSASGTVVKPLTLSADEQVTISLRGQATTVREVHGSAVAGWARGQLVFDNQTIGEIARRFNLYNRVQIRVLNPALGARRMSGVFQADDPKSFVDLVKVVTDTHAVRRDGDVIMLGAPTKNLGGGRQQ